MAKSRDTKSSGGTGNIQGCGCGLDLVGPSCLLGLCELSPCPERAGSSWHLLSMPVGGSELQTSTGPNLEVHER